MMTEPPLDPTPEDTEYRQRCEREFDLRPDPRELDRYPAGYWRECYEYWKEKEVKK